MNKVLFILLVSAFFSYCNTPEDKSISVTPVEINLETQSSTPELFAENEISTHMNERDLAISPDGNEIIFTLGTYNGSKRALVSLKKNEKGKWNSPEILPFSGKYQDIEPFFSPGGAKLYFASTRPVSEDSSRKDYNIWVVDRSDSGYSEPVDIGDIINTPGDEFYPSVAGNGNLYFTATYDSGIGREDIFYSKWINGTFQAPQPLDSAINTETYEFNAYVSPDEDLIIFSSFGRADDLGGGDLYMSQKGPDGNWALSRNLGEAINSSSLDYCPFVDFSRNSFYFTSNRSGTRADRFDNVELFRKEYGAILNGLGNIYQVHLSAIGLSN